MGVSSRGSPGRAAYGWPPGVGVERGRPGATKESGPGRLGDTGVPECRACPPRGRGEARAQGSPARRKHVVTGTPLKPMGTPLGARGRPRAAAQTRTPVCDSRGQNPPPTPGRVLAGPAQPGSTRGVIDSGARTAPAWLADATQSRPTPPPHAPPVLCGSGDIGPPSPPSPPSRVAGCGGRRPFCRLRALTLRPGPRTVTLPGRAGTRVLGPWPELGHETRLPPFAGTAKPSCHRGGRVHFSEQMTSPWAA